MRRHSSGWIRVAGCTHTIQEWRCWGRRRPSSGRFRGTPTTSRRRSCRNRIPGNSFLRGTCSRRSESTRRSPPASILSIASTGQSMRPSRSRRRTTCGMCGRGERYGCPRLVRVPWASTTATLMPRPQRALLEWGRDNGMARSSRLRLQRTVIDLVLPTSRSRLDLRIPRDLRLARLARSIAADPLRAHSLTEDAARLGLSKRTLTRRFREETGESIGRWRALACIRTALPLLADDVPVWMVAIECGYSTPSAFAAAFRRGLGISPRELFSPADGTDSPPAGPLVRPSFGSAVEFATYED